MGRLLERLRRFNRRWIDRLDPDWPPAPAPVAPPVAAPAPAPARPPITVTRAETPNPDAMKFECSVRVVPSGSLSFSNANAASGQPLGAALFAIDGVKSLFAINDFVTVTRRPDADWDVLSPQIEAALRAALG